MTISLTIPDAEARTYYKAGILPNDTINRLAWALDKAEATVAPELAAEKRERKAEETRQPALSFE